MTKYQIAGNSTPQEALASFSVTERMRPVASSPAGLQLPQLVIRSGPPGAQKLAWSDGAWASASRILMMGGLSPVCRSLTKRQGQHRESLSSLCGPSPQSTATTLQQSTKRTVLMQGRVSAHELDASGCVPRVALWFSLCCLSRVSVTSSSAESRLQQRG